MIAQGMKALAQLLPALWQDEAGSGLIEWVLVAALLSLCAIASLHSLASRIQITWQYLATSFNQAI